MIPNHSDVVAQLHAEQPPAQTIEGALAFLLRLIARLQQDFPSERVGLLIKTAGENIVPYAGTSVSAGRITYPDHDLLVKVLTDIPTTNGPSWQAEDGIPDTGHHGGYLPVPVPEPPVPPSDPLEPRVVALELLFHEILKQIGLINQQLANLDAAVVRHPLPEYVGKFWGFSITSRPKL